MAIRDEDSILDQKYEEQIFNAFYWYFIDACQVKRPFRYIGFPTCGPESMAFWNLFLGGLSLPSCKFTLHKFYRIYSYYYHFYGDFCYCNMGFRDKKDILY